MATSIRSSARVAKAQGKRDGKDTMGSDDDHGPTDFEFERSEQEEVKPPRKRQRTTTKSAKATKATARKKQVPNKRGLATLADMPLDIFAEIAAHLLPVNVLSMARLTKLTRCILMHRSSISVWHASMRNVQGLPDCPPDMSEPQFVSLIFSKACSACGDSARTKLDEILRVRLCGPCRTEHLVHGDDVPSKLEQLLCWSSRLTPPKGRAGVCYVLRRDLESITAEYKQVARSESKKAIKDWTIEKNLMYKRRQEESGALEKFLKSVETDHKKEQGTTSKARWIEVQRRLRTSGWEPKDMDFTNAWSTKQKEWRALVLQPKLITDRVWTNLAPKLVPLLEINRDQRLQVEGDARQRARTNTLRYRLESLEQREFPALEFKINLQLPYLPGVDSTATVKYQEPIPEFSQALEWSVFKSLYETDVNVSKMDTAFMDHREEIIGHITEWQRRIHGHFIGLVRDAHGDLEPARGADHPDLVDELKPLLRADVLFYNSSPSYLGCRKPLTYDALAWPYGHLVPSCGYQLRGSNGIPYLNHIVLYPEAQDVARSLLADMGTPNASCLEMKGYEWNLGCGRCHDTISKSWPDLVQHYLQANEHYAAIQDGLSETGITYNHVHDPALRTDRPMVIYNPTKWLPGNSPNTRRVCVLCKKLPVKSHVVAPKPRIIDHLLQVHGVDEPVKGVHYYREKVPGCRLRGPEDSDSEGDCEKQ